MGQYVGTVHQKKYPTVVYTRIYCSWPVIRVRVCAAQHIVQYVAWYRRIWLLTAYKRRTASQFALRGKIS